MNRSNAFIVVSTSLSWFGADDYCYYNYQSHLATISSSTQQQNATISCASINPSGYCWIGLNSLADSNNNNFLWIGNNSLNESYRNWHNSAPLASESCVVILSTDGKWLDTSCAQQTASIFFLCNERNTTHPPSNRGYIGVYVPEYVTWFQADNYCYTKHQSHLVTIHSSAENNEVANICRNMSASDACWIGLNNHISRYDYRWRNDGTQLLPSNYTNWGLNMPSAPSTPVNCAYLGPFIYYGRFWTDYSCVTGVASFVCDVPNSTKSSSSVGFVGVYSSSVTYNFYDADDYCVTNFNSHLATIRTEQENYEASKVCGDLVPVNTNININCYIGLNSVNVNSKYKWINDSSLLGSYNNWYWDNSVPTWNKNYAVVINYGLAPTYWFDVAVSTFQNAFICNPPQNKSTSIVSVGYIAYNAMSFGFATVSFYTANELCYIANQTYLATIKSDKENDEALDVCKRLGDVECFIGANNYNENGHGSSTNWHWIKNDSELIYDKWAGDYPGTADGFVVINADYFGRYWIVETTFYTQGFVCDTAGYAVSPSSIGYIGYIAADINGSNLNFYDANDHCYFNDQSSLATITSKSDDYKAINVCRTLGNSYNCWIGLNDEINAWTWINGSSSDSYTNWFPGVAVGANSQPHAAYINSLEPFGMSWAETSSTYIGSQIQAFICNPPNTVAPATSLGYVAHRTSEIGPGSWTFSDANSFCIQQHRASLATIQSKTQNDEVVNVCRGLGVVDCWIGVNNQQERYTWRWISNSLIVSYEYWFLGVKNANSKGYCGFIHAVRKGYGRYWTYIPCLYTSITAFVCDPPNSKAPTNYPTNNPSGNPTDQSNYPTNNPSKNPTKIPSKNPTKIPSKYPTKIPSKNPTKIPSKNPTKIPSKNPTKIPSKNPSESPTKNPLISSEHFTTDPSKYPTKTPLKHPSQNPTQNPIENTRNVEDLQQQNEIDKQDLESTFSLVTLIIVMVFVIVFVVAVIDGTIVRKNDYFNYGSIFAAFLQTMDMITDCFFAINLSIECKYNNSFYPALFATIAFILIPLAFSLFQLFFYSKKHWMSDDYISAYLVQHSKIIYLLSIVTGSSFSAIALLNSNMFQFDILSIGLSERQMMKFSTKRVYSVVILENLPQLVIQTWYLLTVNGGSGDTIALFSLILSLISIIVTIMSMVMEKQLINTQQVIVLKMNISQSNVLSTADKCKNNVKKIKKYISGILGVENLTTEMIKPRIVAKGLQLKMLLYVNMDNEKTNFASLITETTENGELQEFIKTVWKLQSVPIISNITFQKFQSKRDRKTTDRNNVEVENMTDQIELTNKTNTK